MCKCVFYILYIHHVLIQMHTFTSYIRPYICLQQIPIFIVNTSDQRIQRNDRHLPWPNKAPPFKLLTSINH